MGRPESSSRTLLMEKCDLYTDNQALAGYSAWLAAPFAKRVGGFILVGLRFKVFYKCGYQNTVADAISRLSTYRKCPETPARGAVDD